MATRDLFRPDPDIGYTFIPNLRTRARHESGGYLVETNEIGFRSGPAGQADPASRQILVFGDSFTAGDGVSNGKRWTDALASKLTDSPAGAPGGIELHNFGLPNSGTDQHYLIWRKFARARRADLVVIAVLVENIRRNTSGWRPVGGPGGELVFRAKPYFELDNDGRLMRRHDPVPTDIVPVAELKGEAVDMSGRFPTLRRLINRLGVRDLVQSLTAYQPVPDFDRADSPGWRLMRAILTGWVEEIRAAQGCPVAIVPLPLYQHVEGSADPSAYQARFAELASELAADPAVQRGTVSDIALIDPLPALRAHDAAERRRFRFDKDVHLTPRGHEAIAEAVAPEIAALMRMPA